MTTVTTVAETDIFQWIDKAMENLNFKYHKSTITGTTEKGDGYVGDIVFVKVSATTKDDEKKELNVVVKHGKPDEQLRKTIPTRMAFETEIFFYNTILPSFTRLQEEYNIKNAFDAVPKCYKTLILSNMEVIIMENLKIIGYELHDKLAPLNVGHLKAGLTEYGKLHALSYALKEKQPNEFKAITSDMSEPLKGFLQDKRGLSIMFKNGIADCMKILQENGDTELVEKLKPKLNKDIDDILLDLACEECSHRVITHGDCWNNNFMFKYEDKNKLTPSKIAILDWQLSGLRSPVIDLSYFIYANAAGSKLDHLQLKELMETYYNSFTNFLGNFVHNPEKLFSFSELRNHWRRFSLYGFIVGCCIMRYTLLSKEDTFSFEGLSKGDDMEKVVGTKITDNDLYYSGMTAVTTVAQTDIFQWIDKAIENLNFKYHKSTITGTTEKGDGYVGDVVFVKDKRGIGIMFKNGIADCMKILQENGDTELVEKLKPKLNKDIDDILLDLVCEECSHRVITHGDCWNNNFMFKYEDKNKLTPSKIAILDWQVIGLRSPVIDLSYFIYANAAGSKLDLLQLKELLETYYNSFTNFLGNFVHNPEELFSFSELRNHWRRFSLYGFIMGCCVMRYALLSKEDTFAFEGLSEGDDIEKVVGNKISDKDLFYSRVKDLVRLYVSNEF
ncbi:hypothetical protein NQ317_017757 [Molorchus minor]|uniref:CHK kinase-like domain-containing protein n=1 Tax=Molorchus minor TaxID=1323400 RepID=A0ABQ9JGK3_9CUCU|nr:hypothetical protein NQ317_017757 [Molorchus minor]